MAKWAPVVTIGVSSSPRFVQIAQGIVESIRRGRLTPGEQLPGSRGLATQLGVHRNTVLAALDELEAEGWLTTVQGRGTFVSTKITETATAPATTTRRGLTKFALELAPLPIDRRDYELPAESFSLSGGMPDPRLVPVDELSRAWRRVVKRHGQRLLEYGHPAGHHRLRVALNNMVRALRGLNSQPENVLVTRGSQMALDLCARALIRPNDVVAVERLGYRPAWDALRLSGARLEPIPVDDEGLVVEALETLTRRMPVRAVYVTPHHQYPTTRTLSPARRLALLALARAKKLAILEDDYDHEFHYDGRPVLPLASADESGQVIYIGTLSKVLAPGLRLGFLVASADFVQRLVTLRAVMDRQGDHPMEAAVAELLEEGELQRHVRKMRTAYLERRDTVVKALAHRLGDVVTYEVPRGGISVWLNAKRPALFDAWLERCEALGVRLAPGAHYSFDRRPLGATRLVFSRYSPAELKRAIALMQQAWLD